MHDISKDKRIFPANSSAVKAHQSTRAKIITAFILCLILVLSNFCFLTVFAAEATSNNITVTAGVFKMEGYHMKDDNKNLSGYGIEFLNLVSEYSRLNFQYTGYEHSWDDMLVMLKDGDIDVVTSASRTIDREKEFLYSLPMGRKSFVLSIRVDDMDHIRENYETYQGMKVGLLKDNSANPRLYEFSIKKGFKYVTPTKDGGTIEPIYDDKDAIDKTVNEQIHYYENDA